MAPSTVTTNVEECSSAAASSEDNIGKAVTRGKYPWLRNMWSKRWDQTLKLLCLRKRKKKPHAEQPKVVISKSPKIWLLPIIVHIIPILASIVIAAINLEGYFIGTRFVGVADDQGQSIALLCLQVTAKILEVSVISSLGFIVLDVVHHFLFFDEDGLPFSLAGARLTFTDLFYLASPAFWGGIKAFRSVSLRIIVAALLVSCGFLATFIGPAAALLLIPSNNPSWPAGGLRFLLPLDESEMWPPQLNVSHIGPSTCINPSESRVDSPAPIGFYCLWSGSPTLSSNILYSPWGQSGSHLTIDDTSLREISWSSFNVQTRYNETLDIVGIVSSTVWYWTAMSITNIVSQRVYGRWLLALGDFTMWGFPAPKRTLPLPYARYPLRDSHGDQINLPGLQAPSTRVHCLGSERDFDVAALPYPAIPATGAYLEDTNATILIPSSLDPNTSIIRTFWIPKPTTAPVIQYAETDPKTPIQLPSALLAVQIPLNSESAGVVFTCSVDARWITNATLLMDASDKRVSYNSEAALTTHTEIGAATFDSQGRPGTSGISPMLDLDISWLEQLTPRFNETSPGTNLSYMSPGYNSMAKSLSLSAIRTALQNHHATIGQVQPFIEMLAAMLVVDGMARINGYRFMQSPVALRWLDSADASGDGNILLAGGGGTDPISREASELSYPEYIQTISISGYAYSIKSTGDILALIVVFMYMIFALGHICFILYKRWHSVDWWSVVDMLAVSQNSPASDLLRNTSGGTGSASTNRLLLKLRAPDVALGDRESIQVLVGRFKSDPDQRPSNYHKIEKEKAYY